MAYIKGCVLFLIYSNPLNALIMEKKKLQLYGIKVKSFQTSNQAAVKGGISKLPPCDEETRFEPCYSQIEPCDTQPAILM